MVQNKGLGRGLDALLSSADDVSNSESNLQNCKIDNLVTGKYQPRTHMNEIALKELAESIKAQGIMQPIVVRYLENKRYEIIAGERRWRAAKLANLDEVPILIKNIPDESVLAMALIENIQREDLNAIEEAKGIQRLIDEFGMTHESASETLGKSRTTITNLLRLLSVILQKLNGSVHSLISSICITKNGAMIWNYTDTSELKMKKLSDDYLRNYLNKIDTETLLSYGVYQVEASGLDLFESIKGDMDSIMGLPVKKLKEYLDLLK